MNIVHRDLKPENLLLDHKKNIKIVDFGLSNTYKTGETLKTACGSPCYAAPEMIAGKRYHGSNVDIWSCGVILFALICGYLPFEDPNTANLYKKILNGDYSIPKFVSPDGREMITNLLNTDPEKRFKIGDIRKHAWFNQIPFVKVIGGLFIGLSQIPIHTKVLDMLIQYNFKKDYAVKCINANKHNHVTTTYYLLLKRYIELGEVDDSDVEFFDDKKIQQLTAQLKLQSQQSTQPAIKAETLNQTMPVSKDAFNILDSTNIQPNLKKKETAVTAATSTAAPEDLKKSIDYSVGTAAPSSMV